MTTYDSSLLINSNEQDSNFKLQTTLTTLIKHKKHRLSISKQTNQNLPITKTLEEFLNEQKLTRYP